MKRTKRALLMKLASLILAALLLFSACDDAGEGGSDPTTGDSHTSTASSSVTTSGAEDTEPPVEDAIATIKDWSFQYNDATDDFSLFFTLCNEDEEEVDASVAVDIRIVNDAGETVYEDSKLVFKSDFGYYSRRHEEAHYMANVRIEASEVIPGRSKDGIVYFTVWHSNGTFGECNCDIYDLPTRSIEILTESLPQTVHRISCDGTVEGSCRIDSVTYQENDLTHTVTITVSGEKTYAGDSIYSSYDGFKYKLYDSEGYMVDSGTVLLHDLSVGDKFRSDHILFLDGVPGEAYTVKFFDYQ